MLFSEDKEDPEVVMWGQLKPAQVGDASETQRVTERRNMIKRDGHFLDGYFLDGFFYFVNLFAYLTQHNQNAPEPSGPPYTLSRKKPRGWYDGRLGNVGMMGKHRQRS